VPVAVVTDGPVVTDAVGATDPTVSSLPLPTDPDAPPPTDALLLPDGTATTDFLYAPMNLPAGWTLWDATAIVPPVPTVAVTEQGFGDRDPADGAVVRGIYLTIVDRVDEGRPNASVRGLPALWVDDYADGREAVVWHELGAQIVAMPIGLTRDETEAVLAPLVWRADPLDGVDPGSSAMPLLAESRTDPSAEPQTAMLYRISPPDGPEFQPVEVNQQTSGTWRLAHDVRIVVGAQLGGWSSVQVEMFGTLLGATNAMALGGYADGSTSAVLPNGTLVQMSSWPSGEGPTAPELIASLGARSTSDIATMVRASHEVLARQPLLDATTMTVSGDTVTVERRGASETGTTVICVDFAGDRDCRPAMAYSPFWDDAQVHATAMVVGGVWWLVGDERAGDADVRAVRWRPDLTSPMPLDRVDQLDSASTVIGLSRVWIAAAPPGLDLAVLLRDTPDGLAGTGSRSPYARPPW